MGEATQGLELIKREKKKNMFSLWKADPSSLEGDGFISTSHRKRYRDPSRTRNEQKQKGPRKIHERVRAKIKLKLKSNSRRPRDCLSCRASFIVKSIAIQNWSHGTSARSRRLMQQRATRLRLPQVTTWVEKGDSWAPSRHRKTQPGGKEADSGEWVMHASED